MNVLIIENDNNVIKNLVDILYCNNITVTENAFSAIKYINDNDYDLIFIDDDLDFEIINGSGYDVIDYLYNRNIFNSTIVIHSSNKHFIDYAIDKIIYCLCITYKKTNWIFLFLNLMMIIIIFIERFIMSNRYLDGDGDLIDIFNELISERFTKLF